VVDTRESGPDGGVTEIVFPFKSTWKYLDKNVAPSASWTGSGAFDDSSWASGPAPLGYDYLDEGTVVSFGTDATNKYITTWFRRSFTIVDAARYDGFTVRMQRDDGAVVYVNGVELARPNMPTGTITASTLANVTVSGMDFTIYSFPGAASLLKTGTNVIAVEVHQASLTSSDLRLELELDAHRP
jgi:hypothetical protein